MLRHILTFKAGKLFIIVALAVCVTALLLSPAICGQSVEQMLMLNSNFRCDQIYKSERCDFSQTLLCYLSQTLLVNKPLF